MPDEHLPDERLTDSASDGWSAEETAHLERCVQCAERRRDWQAAAAAFAVYQKAIHAPTPWRSLDSLVREKQGQKKQLLRWWWAPALAAAFGLVLFLRPAPQADQLLTRSALLALEPDRTISLRTHGRTVFRPAVLTSEGTSDPDLLRLQAQFESARYSWREPLSSRSFQGWRRLQEHRRDSVTTIGDGHLYRVRTEVPNGALRSASLTLRAKDLRPTAGDFVFTGNEAVSMEETEKPAEAVVAPPTPKVVPVETPLGPADTLRVLAALDDLGLDPGEPIDVMADVAHRRVVVRAGALAAERQQQIAAALVSLPRVTVDTSPIAHGKTPAADPSAQSYESSIPAGIRKLLEDRFGGAIAIQEATDQALETSAQILARAHAMEVLANHFPPDAEARMSEPDRARLRRLREKHLNEMERLSSQLASVMRPLLEPPSVPGAQAGDIGSWQTGVPSLMAAARETDRLLNRFLAGSYSQTAGEEMRRGLAPALHQLETIIRSQPRGQ